MKLAPTGVVSGRIFESSGQSAIGIPVRLLRSAYNAEGRVFRTVGTATANDRGEYRIYDVPPGHYYLGAGTPGMPAGSVSAPSRAPGASPVANYAMTYYPGVADLTDAKLLRSGNSEAIRKARPFRWHCRVFKRDGQYPGHSRSKSIGRRFDPKFPRMKQTCWGHPA